MEVNDDDDSAGKFEKMGRVLLYKKKKISFKWLSCFMDIKDGTMSVVNVRFESLPSAS